MLASKEYQPDTFSLAQETFAAVEAGTLMVETADWHETLEKWHWRAEPRTYQVVEEPAKLAWLQTHDAGAWAGLRTLAQVQATCQRGDRLQQETRFFVSNLEPDAERRQQVIRRYWAIENELHWVLDSVLGRAPSDMSL